MSARSTSTTSNNNVAIADDKSNHGSTAAALNGNSTVSSAAATAGGSSANSQQQPQQAQQNHHPIIHHPESGIEDRLQYLREHRVCERLELMVRGLITQRPDDPVIALCAYLKEADRTLGFGGVPSNGSNNSSNHLHGGLTNSSGAHHNHHHLHAGSQFSHLNTGNNHPQQQQQHGLLHNNTTHNSSTNLLSRFGSGSSLRSTSQPTSPVNTKMSAGNGANGGGGAAAALNNNNLPPLAVRQQGAAGGAFETRSVATPSVASGRVASAAANNNNGNNNGPATGRSSAVDRDESARSDLSLFSIQSIDMGEFLSEFRAAHHALFGGTKQRISFQDLADIVDRVAVPLPDTNMLAALFCEMERSTATGLVVFEGFLSRMAQRIQGRFTSENLAGLFLQLASSSSAAAAAANNNNSNSNGSAVTSPRSARAAAVTSSTTGVAAGSGRLGQSASSASLVIDAAISNPNHTGVRPSSSAASTDAALVAHTTWVPAKTCVDEGMEALGVRKEDAANSSTQCAAVTSSNANNLNSPTAAAAWSIQDFLRVANTVLGGMAVAGAAAAPFRHAGGGSMSNFGSVQDLASAYE